MKTKLQHLLVLIGFLLGSMLASPRVALAATAQIIGWNDYGVDRLDSDYSVFSLWPPGNTIRAQLIYQGRRVTNATGITVTYQAVGDPDGSTNSTSQGKTGFWDYALPLYGTNLAVNMGVNGYAMPGTNNAPQVLTFNRTNAWFSAEGVPITPLDDRLRKNYFPLMRVIARSNSVALATNDIVMAISDEVNCRVCHASGTDAAAQPAAGWVWNGNPEHDYRLNILRLHDQLRNPATYPGILTSNGYNPAGLYRTVLADNKPVLCVRCHQSTAQPGSGFGSISALTRAIHSQHANVIDPETGVTLNNSADRSSCFQCHPGAASHALRGAMGDAVAANGVRAIQCQNCHGTMSAVGATNRVGWVDLPDCQRCHTGNAVNNNGQIRYTTAFLTNGTVRQAVDKTFATVTNRAFGNYSLYRTSTNHGRLFCAACHGAAHAEFPANRNDNIRVQQVQGHQGTLSDCNACHSTIPGSGQGPHGAHEFGPNWVDGHISVGDSPTCMNCHGADERGTILSLAQKDETLTSSFGTKQLWRGFRVGCYLCHQGSGTISQNPVGPAIVTSLSTNTTSGKPVVMTLAATDPNTPAQTLELRIISQPAGGMVGLSNRVATYYPEPGFVGTETFTFAAWNGATDSNLGTGVVAVAQGAFSIKASTQVPPSYPAGWPAPFGVIATPSNVTANVTYDWNFGDASPHRTNDHATHAYAAPGTYAWSVISTVQAIPLKSATNSGSIVIGNPVQLSAAQAENLVALVWPRTAADAILEQSGTVGPAPQWSVTRAPYAVGSSNISVLLTNPPGNMFYRLRKP